MNWKTGTYLGILSTVLVTSVILTWTGAALPGPDETTDFSMRNVQNRRTHFMRYYSFGK